MRFTCEKNMLVTGLNIAGRTVAQKSSLSVIEGILCKAGQGLSLTGYNMETAITYEIDADVSDMGQCILPAKLFGDIIRRLPEGYDTVIGEGGGTLSGGEKQRISIARAMLKNAPIIILDEATSSVDPENEDELQRAIEALTHDKTIIMIAHRLKTVRNADQILVLDNAHIVQRGTHAELIQQKGLYADFVSARQEAIGWKLAQ